jgi:hypothetical protein
MHNVLKNFRSLSPESADRLMEVLNLNLPALICQAGTLGDSAVQGIPVVRNRIGPGTDTVLSHFRGFMPFATDQVASLVDPVVAQLAPDMVIPKSLAANDYVLLDQNPELRAWPRGGGCWVIAEGNGLRVRYVKLGGTRLYLASEATVRDPPRWEPAPLDERTILEIVRARIVWIGRQMEVAPAAPADPAGGGNRSSE